MRPTTRVRTVGALLGAVIATGFIALPLLGRPSLIRIAPVLLFAFIVIALTATPWKWAEEEWSAFAEWRPARRQMMAGTVVVGLLVFWLVLTRFRSGEINAIDFTVYYDRPTFQTAMGHPMFVESADDPARAFRSYLVVHAHWAMVPLSAFYLIWPSPLWLLALSVAAVVAGAVYVIRIIQHSRGGNLLALASGLAFALNANTARTLNYGFHTEVLYAWFIPWAIYSGLTRKWRSFIVATLGCVSVKEDAFLFLIAIVVTLVLVDRGTWTGMRRALLMIPLAVSLANLIVYQQLLLPRISATGAEFYASYWSNFGPTPMLAALGMLKDPIRVARLAITSSFLTSIITPHLFLPFLGWRWFVGVIPVVLLYGASANEQLRSFGIYYAIPLVPFLVLGAAYGASHLARRFSSSPGRGQVIGSALVLAGSLVAGISDAGYSLRPWRSEISNLRGVLNELAAERVVLVQSSLYPHAGYDSKVQLLTQEALVDPRNAGAAVVVAQRMSSYPMTQEQIGRLSQLPVVTSTPAGLTVLRNPIPR